MAAGGPRPPQPNCTGGEHIAAGGDCVSPHVAAAQFVPGSLEGRRTFDFSPRGSGRAATHTLTLLASFGQRDRILLSRRSTSGQRLRSPRSPWPFLLLVLALLGRSAAVERLTSSLSRNCPRTPRRTYRLSVRVLISSRFAARRFAIYKPPRARACNPDAEKWGAD